MPKQHPVNMTSNIRRREVSHTLTTGGQKSEEQIIEKKAQKNKDEENYSNEHMVVGIQRTIYSLALD